MNRIDLPHRRPALAVSTSRPRSRGLAPLLVLLGLGSVAPLASAATCTWVGAGSDVNWSNPANWDGCATAHLVPQDNDTLLFPVVAANRTNINDLADLDLTQVVFTGASYVITGNAISLISGIVSSVAPGGSSDVDPVFGLNVALLGTGQAVQCLGARGLTLTGAFDLGGFGLGFDGVCEIRMQGSASGGGGLTKAGTGRLILSAANTYTGQTTVSAGTLLVRDGQALGANGTQTLQNGVAIAQGATLQLEASLVVVDEPLTLNGTGGVGGGGGALQTTSGSSVWTGPIFLGSDTSVGTASASQLTLTGVITDAASGSATLTKVGAGTLELSGANTYRGLTTVTDGVLTVASDSALGASGTAASGATILTGATIEAAAGITTGETLTLSGAGFGGAGAVHVPTGSVVFKDVVLAGDASVAVGGGATLTFSGNTSGSADLTKELTGTLVLSGTNTYTGSTFINSGILTVQSAGALGGTGNGTTVSNGATLQLQASLVIWNEPLILNGTGMNNTGALRNIGGNNTWAGPITLATNSSIGSDSAGGALTLSGDTGGSAGLTKVGPGTLVLSGANTYAGVTQVNEGVLLGNSDGSFGAGSGPGGGTTVAAGAALQLEGSIVVASESLSLSGTGISGTGALLNVGGNNTWSGNINLDANTSIGNAVGTTLTLSGNTSGSAALTKVGTGTLILSSNNSYSGLTTIQEGVLTVTSGGALGTAAAGTAVLDGAQLRTQGSMTINESLTLNGSGIGGAGAVHASGGVFTVTFGGALTMASDTSIEIDADGTLTLGGGSNGVGGLTKTGAGTLTLAGTNTYTGTTTVNGGVLLLTGSVNTATVNTGASLEGNGTAGAITLNAGGVIAPIGTLTASSLLWNGDGVIEAKLGGIGGGGDRLQLAGTMQKGSGTGQLYRLYGDVDGSAAPVPGLTYVLTTYTGTTFVETDLSFVYGGPRGTALTGELIVTPTQVEFVPITVSLFRDGFETP